MFKRALRLFTDFKKDYYKIMGVSQNVTKEELRSAYLKLAKQYHPDSSTGNEEKFKQISEAWEVLGNPRSKEEYDMMKSQGKNPFDPYRNSRYSGYYNPNQGHKLVFVFISLALILW